MVGIHSTVGKQAKRTPDTAVETTYMLREGARIVRGHTFRRKWMKMPLVSTK